MTPPKATKTNTNNAPQWLIKAGMEGGWVGSNGQALPVDQKPAKKPVSTDNSKGYAGAQGLKSIYGGIPNDINGLKLSDAPPLGGKAEGIPMAHGIRTGGVDKSNQILAAHPGHLGGTHVAKAPSFRSADDVSRSGSDPSRAAGPKAKPGNQVHTPDLKLSPGGAQGVYPYGSTRTYNLVPNK